MTDICPIDSENSSIYKPLIYSLLADTLEKTGTDNNLIAFGSSIFGKPVGLAFAQINGTGSLALESIFIQEKYRRQGIGTALLNRIEEEAVKRKISLIEIKYRKKPGESVPMEGFLAENKFSEPEKINLIFLADRMVLNATWMEKFRLPSEYRIFFWKDILQSDLDMIRKKRAVKPFYPDYLSPFITDYEFEPANSLGLYFRDEIAGWMITRRIAEDTLLYANLFVREDLQGLARAIPLLAESIKLSGKIGVYRGMFSPPVSNDRFIRFVRKHMSEFIVYEKEEFICRKKLCNE